MFKYYNKQQSQKNAISYSKAHYDEYNEETKMAKRNLIK